MEIGKEIASIQKSWFYINEFVGPKANYDMEMGLSEGFRSIERALAVFHSIHESSLTLLYKELSTLQY